jgi:hypothetical protein
MSNTKDIVQKTINETVLSEAATRSLSRVYNHAQNRNIGMISAQRGENTAAENRAADLELRDHIRKAGLGYVRVKSRYTENQGTPQERKVSERSLLVMGKKGHDSGHLLGHLRKWGKHYKQDAILHKTHDREDAELHDTKGDNKPMSVGKWHPNRTSEYSSHMKGGRSFVFESIEFVEEHSFFNREDDRLFE